MRHVGDAGLQALDLLVQRVDFALHAVLLLAQLASFFLAGLARRRIGGLADRLGDFVGAPIEILHLALLVTPQQLEFHEPIHVGRDAAVDAVLLDLLRILNDELPIQHGCVRFDPARVIVAEWSAFAPRKPTYPIRSRHGDLAQLAPQIGAGPDAAMEVRQAELLVGAVRVVVVLSPAEQQRVDAELVAEQLTIGIEPPSRMNTGGRPNPARWPAPPPAM